MCGVAGVYHRRPRRRDELQAAARAMSDRLAHRGPDDRGEFVDESSGLAIGFRRLAIIDLSPAGHQPMRSASGRYIIAFNGEIYNFRALREELERIGAAPQWRGHSDTEVALAAFERWGVEESLQRFVGMFGFVLWDSSERTIHLIRDRIGVKPMYYAVTGDSLLFGSELKALLALREFEGTIDSDVLALYARFGYVPAPYTIYRNAWKLPPGSILSIGPGRSSAEPRKYWSVEEMVLRGTASRFRGSENDALEQLDALLADAVRLRMISDVPLGVFLSGGIDSSTVVAQMQRQNTSPVKTFSIGFHEKTYDEARFAASVARHLGTDHTELLVTPREALDVIPLLPRIYDEPFSDPSQIPTYLVSRLARRSVTVSLSGDGGDEFFGGYNRYFIGRRLWRGAQSLPNLLRRTVSRGLRGIPMSAWNALLSPERRFVPRSLRRERAGERIYKLARAMESRSIDALYAELVSQWTVVVPGARELPIAIHERRSWSVLVDFTERMMFLDQISYLPDDILVKVDRASMAVSLESREPLLDHRVMEFAWTLPLDWKVRNGKGKWLLRRLLRRYVPNDLMERPKMGFALPINHWLRGPLREWADSLLDPKRLQQEGYFDSAQISAMWREHVDGRGEWQQYLWTILMFQAWLDEQRAGSASIPRHDAHIELAGHE